MRISLKHGINIGRVVAKIVGVVIALYVGGTVMTTFGTAMNCTSSPMYSGLTLIGWTVASTVTNTNATVNEGCWSTLGAGTFYNVITGVSGSGVLAVIGIIGIASIVMEFVSFKM